MIIVSSFVSGFITERIKALKTASKPGKRP